MCFLCAAALTMSIVRGTLIHQDLLSRIGQGQLSLLFMEPPHYGPKEEPLLEWIRRHQEMSMLEPRGILEDCLRSFNKHFSELPEEKWTFNVLTELLSMLFSLQMQPCMMDQYRRFVVITGKQDKIAPDRGGVSIFLNAPHMSVSDRRAIMCSSNGRILMASTSGTTFSRKRKWMTLELGRVSSRHSLLYNLLSQPDFFLL